ncbi:MAG: hypothetical protein E7652_01710 [Ruminococcaceae bacterium]|nr:hypothetical protein [Oscillospiraceae bacterium]
MKKFFKYFYKEIVLPASFLFTLYVFAMYGIAMLINNLIDVVTVHPLVLLMGFIYSIIIFASAKIFKTGLSMALKIIINYSCYVIPFLAILMIAARIRGNNDASPLSPSTIITIIIVTSVIYAIIATPILIVRHILKRRAEKKEVYESQFNEI